MPHPHRVYSKQPTQCIIKSTLILMATHRIRLHHVEWNQHKQMYGHLRRQHQQHRYVSIILELLGMSSIRWVIYVHAYTWKKWHHKGSHSSSVSGSNRLVWLQTCKIAMGWCTAQWKMLLFCAKKESQIWTSHLQKKKKKESKTFWPSGDFLVQYFCDAVCCLTWKHSKMNGRLL